MSFIRKQAKRSTKITAKSLQDILLKGDALEDALEFDEELEHWKAKWDQITEGDRKNHVKKLFELAFTVGDHGWYYSFCCNAWEDENCTTHCWTCGKCQNWREWHCKRCNKCRFGVLIPCPGCGGVSDTYEFSHEMSRERLVSLLHHLRYSQF